MPTARLERSVRNLGLDEMKNAGMPVAKLERSVRNLGLCPDIEYLSGATGSCGNLGFQASLPLDQWRGWCRILILSGAVETWCCVLILSGAV
jgi:hypothetical protein